MIRITVIYPLLFIFMVFSYKPAKSIKAIKYIIVGVLTLCSLIVQLFTFLFVPLFSILTSKVTKRLQSFFCVVEWS